MANRQQAFIPPLHWISEHDDDPGLRLDGTDEILSEERRFCRLVSSVKETPGLVVPHSGGTGFSCNNTDSFSWEIWHPDESFSGEN